MRGVAFLLACLAVSCGKKPQPERPAAYIDSQRCQPCHAAIFASYQKVGMARSFYRPAPANVIEDYEKRNTLHHRASGLNYEMLRRDGRFFQRRYEKEADGREVHPYEREVHFIVGSGNHARSYLHRTTEGELIELPVSWYPQAKRWGMSPGFDRPDHPDFRRRIDHGCMFCHNAYPRIAGDSARYGRQAVFPAELPMGIDCQRCHGPGSRHVETASRGGTPEAVHAAIVNPARLSVERQMDVCMQCHLETTSEPLPASTRRFGRDVYSFRPGEPLGAYMVYFDHPAGSPRKEKFEIAGAAYRLRESACFQKSGGRMTCTTCHNPHQAITKTNSCVSCHTKPHTTGDCAGCHMPKRRTEDAVHVLMTDHRIERRPSRDLLAPLRERHESYRGPVSLYYPRELPAGERDLYLGIAHAADGADRTAGIAALRSVQHAKALVILADALLAEGRGADAIQYYRKAFELEPGLEKARLNFLQALPEKEALREAERLALERPRFADAHYSLGLLWARRGDRARAAASFRQAVALRDDFVEAHAALGEMLADEQSLRAAVQLDPRLAAPRLNLGRLLYQSSRQAEGVKELRAVVGRHPQFAEAHLSLGVVLGEQGDLDGAIREFREVLRLAPGHPEAARNLQLALEMKR